MTEPRAYEFTERHAFSQGTSTHESIQQLLVAQIPGAVSVAKANLQADKSGTDYWVNRRCGYPLSVDVKVRSEDWAAKGCDDLALEIWSVIEQKVPGWTLNEKKRTDYVLWLWKDTGRWCLVSFPMLQQVFRDHLADWGQQYKHATQFTPDRGYHSECLFVPRSMIWRTMYEHYGGKPPKTQA